MSAYSYQVVCDAKERGGECAAVIGELICQLPAGHKGPHRDGSAMFTVPKPRRQKASWSKWGEKHEFDIQCD